MARIRTIKPEFFTSESVLSVSPLARLFFIGLWCEADRDGRLKWKPKTLKFRYLPGDSVNIEKLCTELEDEGMILTYTVGEVDYCEIPSFADHQVINNREKDSLIPSRDSDASTTRESGRKEGKEGKEGKGKSREPLDYSKWPSLPDEQILKDWLSMRKSKKANVSQTVINNFAKQLALASSNGFSVNDCLSECITRSWTGFKAEWMKSNFQQQPKDQVKAPRMFGE